ncbi:hypothetical protein Glove_22g187 [Diversispora epigaea]|uniref:PH domain-containing protein n=1 Tax=Diversispora epigaea TaxID=1348612 RepID=A0A397JJN7_9GLOM|nr:hypothetical protein Glove_22g187 [Diversispora epigaea]
MSVKSSKTEIFTSRTPESGLKIITRRNSSVVEESLKTYKLLDVLRSGNTTALSNILSTYQQSSPPSPSAMSISGTFYVPSTSSSSSGSSISSISLLILAVQCATLPTIEFILNNFMNKININHQDHQGNTALHCAARIGRVDVCKLLLKQKNINDTIPNNESKQAIDVAENSEITALLDENRARYVDEITSLFGKYLSNSNYDGIRVLFQDPRASALIDINFRDSTGSTLLHDAARKKDYEMVTFCLEHGADISIQDRKRKVAADITKDESIKTLLKQATAISGSSMSSPLNQPPKLKGYLLKWTNYASGYKSRWFVLENGILSYFKNQDDARNSCRGSINMINSTTISIDKSDAQRFSIIGKGGVRYHLRAAYPNEAKRWITALTRSTIKYDKDQKNIRSDDVGNEETVRQGKSKHKSDSNTEYSQNSELINEDFGDHTISPSDASIEAEGTSQEDSFQMAISNARVQLDLQNQLLQSLLSMVPKPPLPDSKESILIETFSKSLSSLHSLIEDIARMSDAQEVYWKDKLKKELEIKQGLENIACELGLNQAEMEEVIQHNVVEEKILKKQLKAAVAEIPPTSPLLRKSDDYTSVIVKNKSSTELTNISSMTSTLADEYDSDEFYDAIDGRETQDDLINNSNISDDEAPYIVNSYNGYPNEFRERLPIDSKSSRPEVSLWSILKNSIGKDLSKITLPVYFNEPTSMLQRMAEDMEYSELLDNAARQKGSTERILYVAAFAMSNYSSTVGRIAKPFNPLLGETYEYVRPDRAFRYVSEQVLHHPPVSACYCESPNYNFFAEVDVKSKFWGKSFEILPQGVSHVDLKVPKDRWPNGIEGSPENLPARGSPNAFSEHYSWKKVTTCVYNLIVGTPWIDHYGDMVIVNHLTGDKCVLTFKARGWRGKDAFEIRGYVKDSNDKEIWEIAGRWNERLVARRCGTSLSSQEEDLGSDTAAQSATLTNDDVLPSPSINNVHNANRRPIYLLWKRKPLPEEPLPFNLTPFAITLNDLSDSLEKWVAPTDSRLRPDQRALENGSYDLASSEKIRLEEKQREKRKNREQGLNGNHVPRWFKRDIEPDTGEKYWVFNHEYWLERERAGKEKMQKTGEGKWNIEDHIF